MISRRTFIRGAAITAAALVAADSPSAHAGEFTGRIKKAVKYGMIRGRMSVHDKMALLKKLGFDGVEPGVGDKVEPRPMMYLALSYDHRIIDGREAVTFLVRVKECLEDPERILLDM